MADVGGGIGVYFRICCIDILDAYSGGAILLGERLVTLCCDADETTVEVHIIVLWQAGYAIAAGIGCTDEGVTVV